MIRVFILKNDPLLKRVKKDLKKYKNKIEVFYGNLANKNDVEELEDIDVIVDDTFRYYVTKGEIFTIEVHIDNPNDYEIQSFTLNGQKYANYMFKVGSTMELLLLDVEAPMTSGHLEYTIDAIKYIDGTEIKDVKIGGEKTVKAGVKYDNEPTARILNTQIKDTSVTIDFELNNYGGSVKSEALIEILKSAIINKGREFIFNDDFLLYLKEEDKQKPYFALKVDNLDVLEKVVK